MNLHLNINDVVTWLLASGFLFALYFKVLSPAAHQWIATQKASKAKQVEEVLLNLADTAVQGLSTSYNMTGSVKKQEAVAKVNKALSDKGISIDPDRVSDSVERAYQAFAQTNAPAVKKQAVVNGATVAQSGGPINHKIGGIK
ncbi:phage holin, LLH family [Furfurilactobacillus curtus]|uniref:Phage holin n=1 Tax=Furfurilactobacillus curtus TaxID=1746200 RepID=A0ABQ5JKS9_9LACO